MVKLRYKYHSLYHNERNLIMEQRMLKAACYCRLSDDDVNDGTSISIETQITIAKQYCKANYIEIVNFYTDDGYTGTNFERPAFKKMIADIDKGKVNTVIVKDLSRFGRETIMVNYYTQMFFPENNITFIIIADNTKITANSTYDYMLTIKSAINEIYPAEVSQKVRQAFKAKSMNGEFLHPWLPYGYVKSETSRNHLVIDEKNAQVVRDIFEMVAYKGMGMIKIADYLLEHQILSPAALRDYSRGDYSNPHPYRWSKTSINNLLHNEVYLVKIVYGKRRKVNFKSKKVISTDKNEWIREVSCKLLSGLQEIFYLEEIQMCEYYYGTEAEQFNFIKIPRAFFTDKERFGTLSNEAKIMYSLLLDRMNLSMKNGWLDENMAIKIM